MASVTHDVVHEAAAEKARVAQPYMNPYLAGIGLGLVLLAAFVLVGRGLGASGRLQLRRSPGSSRSWPPATRSSNEFLSALPRGGHAPAQGLARLRGRRASSWARSSRACWPAASRAAVEKGPRVSVGTRLAFAFVGGALMAIGAAFARGCTSGQALTGGSLLNLGSWASMMCIFGGAYAVAWFFRRQWR